MAFRRQPTNPNPYPFANQPGQPAPGAPDEPPTAATTPPGSRKRARAASDVGGDAPGGGGDPFHHENGSDASEGSDDGGGKPDKKAGRRKIKIEFIQDKSRRHITFSKRKAGIMKKAYELSTLTGTQVLLLVVSETGLVYTFTTAKLQPLVTQPEGKNLIQACLNAPHGAMPSSLPVGTPIGRNTSGSGAGAGGVGMGSGPGSRNVPGGLAIGGEKDADADHGTDDDGVREDADASPAARIPAPQRRPSNASSGKSPDGQGHSPTLGHRKPSSPSSPHAQHPAQPPPLGALPPLHHAPTGYGGPYSSPGQGNPALVGLANVGVAGMDPGMYGHHSHYLPQPGSGAGPGGYMGGGQGQGQSAHWPQPGQAGYARR